MLRKVLTQTLTIAPDEMSRFVGEAIPQNSHDLARRCLDDRHGVFVDSNVVIYARRVNVTEII